MKRPPGRFVPLIPVIAAMAAFGISSAQAATTFTVCASGCNFTTIQPAINAALSGDTISVLAGTYAQQLVIDKNVTLTGAGSGTTIIQAPATLSNDPDGTKTVVLFTGAISAEFRGFTVRGPVDGVDYGIYVRLGAAVNIHDDAITDIRDEPLSGRQSGVGIQVGEYYTVHQTGTATITSNRISGYQKIGIAVENTGSSGTLTGNTVTGAGPTTITAQNGIQLRRGATGSIRNNVVTGNAWNGPTWSSFGIGVTFPGSGVVVQGNTVNHNSANIYCWASDGVQVLDNQVSDSATVDQNKVAGITVQTDNAATDSSGLTGITISDNTVQNNLSGTSTQSDGIDLYGIKSGTVSNNIIAGSSYDGILIGGSGNIAFTGNRFTGNGLLVADPNAAAIDFRGIPSRDWSQPLGNGGPNPLGGFTVHSNTFTGNRNAIWNYDVGSVDATNNWFGTAAGPGTLTNIATTPWATDSGFTTQSDNADLTALSLSSGTLRPAFDPSRIAYTANVGNVTGVAVTTSTNPGAGAVVSGGSSLAVGRNAVTVTVTSADGSATRTYTITVVRSAPPPPGVPPETFGMPTSATATSDVPTTLTASVDVAIATVSVPAGALPSGTTVSLYPVVNAAPLTSKVPRGQSYLISFAVSWQAPDGSCPAASAPITMTITDPGIHVGDAIYEVTSSGLKAVGTAKANGIATITFTNDPTFVVAATPKLVRAWIVGRVVRSSIRMRLGCKAGAPCRGTGKLSVARTRERGTKTIVTRVTVATARFSLAPGRTTNVAFHITASGRVILARHVPSRWVSMRLVTTVTGASRSVQRAFVLVPGLSGRPTR